MKRSRLPHLPRTRSVRKLRPYRAVHASPDPYTKTYLPRHVTLTEQFFKLLEVNLDLLFKEREERLRALAEGILAPGEVMSVKAARQRFDEKVAQALKVRRERAIEQKRLSRIARSTQLDDRQFQIAAR